MLQDAFSLLAYANPWNSPVGWQLDPQQRETVCARLNSAILADIRQEFTKILKKVDWMDEETRKSALNKAASMSEESRRGRRSHISHITFEKDGVRHMRMKFYIQGIRRRATVNLEVQEDESGNYVYRYLYVLVDDILQTIIKIEDNREQKRRSITEAELEWN